MYSWIPAIDRQCSKVRQEKAGREGRTGVFLGLANHFRDSVVVPQCDYVGGPATRILSPAESEGRRSYAASLNKRMWSDCANRLEGTRFCWKDNEKRMEWYVQQKTPNNKENKKRTEVEYWRTRDSKNCPEQKRSSKKKEEEGKRCRKQGGVDQDNIDCLRVRQTIVLLAADRTAEEARKENEQHPGVVLMPGSVSCTAPTGSISLHKYQLGCGGRGRDGDNEIIPEGASRSMCYQDTDNRIKQNGNAGNILT